MSKIIEVIDKSTWTKIHWLMFASLAVGFFMWGIIGSIAYLIYPSINAIWFLLTPTFALIAGDIILPFLSDKRLGRKTTFFITMSLYSIGTILLIISAVLANFNTSALAQMPYLLLIVLGIILGELGVEGEVPVMLSYSAEMFPLSVRDQILILAPNFDNIGAMVASLIGFVTYSFSNSFIIELLSLSIVAILGIITAIIIRLMLPESVRWLVSKGDINKAEKEIEKLQAKEKDIKVNEAERKVSLSFRYLFLAIIGVSQYLTYGLMAYTVADIYFSGSTVAFIVFIANLGASVAGFIAALLINRIKSRVFALLSYLGGTITMIPIILLTFNFNLIAFYLLLLLNMTFSEFGWATRTIYEPVLMPTNVRAFMVGLVRMVPAIAYAISVYVAASYLDSNILIYLIYNLALWGMGATMTIIWYFKGIDVNRVSLEKISENTSITSKS